MSSNRFSVALLVVALVLTTTARAMDAFREGDPVDLTIALMGSFLLGAVCGIAWWKRD